MKKMWVYSSKSSIPLPFLLLLLLLISILPPPTNSFQSHFYKQTHKINQILFISNNNNNPQNNNNDHITTTTTVTTSAALHKKNHNELEEEAALLHNDIHKHEARVNGHNHGNLYQIQKHDSSSMSEEDEDHVSFSSLDDDYDDCTHSNKNNININNNIEVIRVTDDYNSNTGDTYYLRDEDDMDQEREDRLYVENAEKIETCILVGCEDLSYKRRSKSTWNLDTEFSLEESLTEMRELIKTAGLHCIGEVTQRLNDPNPKTYIGTGKVKEVNDLALEHGCTTIVFDAELSPGQQKALENAFNKKLIQNDFYQADGEIKVIDRTALILDIFAQHARTREGKLQVELALNIYRKPRMTRLWTHLERQSGSGGVGLRGMGETQLEIDKRLIRDKIIGLRREIDRVQNQRTIHRRGRKKLGLPIIALVGYTNAGKSTLLNYLTRAGVLAENILFATLDPTTRRVKLPGLKTHPEVLLTDTVGFIQALPTQLVAAFRATLEEVQEADILVNVIDVTSDVWRKQEASVKKVLDEIGAGDKPVVRCFNKIDKMDGEDAEDVKIEALMDDDGLSVAISAQSGEGVEDFVACLEEALSSLLTPIEVLIPYSKGLELNMIHEVGAVEAIDYRENGTYVLAKVPVALANKLKEYSISMDNEEESLLSPEEREWAAIGKGRHSTPSVE